MITVTLPAVYDPVTETTVSPVYHYGYDANGNQTSIVDPLGRTTVFTYDTQGHETSRTLPIGVSTTSDSTDFVEHKYYDADGRLSYEVSFEGVVTSYVYDDSQGSGGRLVQKKFFTNLTAYNNGSGTPSEIVVYEYDAFGRQVEVIQDEDGNLSTTTDQLVTNNAYNLSGNLVMVASPEGVIHYEFDPVTGLHTQTWTASDTTTTVANATTDTHYAYDTLGRLTEVTQDRRNGSAITAESTDYVYDLLGNLKQERLPNGVVSDYTYDSLNRLELLKQFNDTDADGVQDVGENLLSQYDYELLADGKRSGVVETDDADNVTTIDWVYDNIGRLTEEQYDSYDNALDFTADYVYDLVGNRLTKTVDKGNDNTIDETVTSTYDANDRLLTEAKDVAGTDDDRFTVYEYGTGNVATQQTSKVVHQGLDDTGTVVESTVYEYNLQGRMSKTEVDSDGDGNLEERYEYTYDSDGIRVSQTVTTDTDNDGSLEDETPVVTKYLNDKQNPTGYSQVLEERDVAGITIKTYKVGLTIISQQGSAIYGGAVLYLLKDGHGSTRMLVDATGQVVNSGGLQVFRYDAFGNRLDSVTALTSILYSGEQTDATGLQYLRARYYDPNTGRFNRLDPFAGRMNDPLTLHKYLYCHGDGINGIDPTGMWMYAFPTVHKDIVDEALRNVGIPVGNQLFVQGIHEGVCWNDRPDGIDIFAAAYVVKGRGIQSVFPATYQNDFSTKQYIHGLVPYFNWRRVEWTVDRMRDEIERWIKNCYLASDPGPSLGPRIDTYSCGLELGKALHTLADIYCQSHVTRQEVGDQVGAIWRFQDYGVQDPTKHAKADHREGNEKYYRAAVKVSTQFLQDWLDGANWDNVVRKWLCGEGSTIGPLSLAPGAQYGGTAWIYKRDPERNPLNSLILLPCVLNCPTLGGAVDVGGFAVC